MDRRAKILKLCRKDGKGLEIGPSYNPVAPRRDGWDVEIVDHATTEELRRKYAAAGVDVSRIEAVDHVWRGEPLQELIGGGPRYDWIVASHVVEHVPDLVSTFRSCSALLKPGGVLSLAIPDKRYCFDYFRWPSSTGDVLQAWFEKRRLHAPGTVFDHFSLASHKGGVDTWSTWHAGRMSFAHAFSFAKAILDEQAHGDAYVDAHAWQFTPSSFRLVLHDLRALGLVDLAEVASYPTKGCEFFVTLGVRPGRDADAGEDRLALCEQMVREVAAQTRTRSVGARALRRAAVRARGAALRLLRK